jgi:hypothetical protein
MKGNWNNGEENHNWVIVQDNGEPLRFDTGELVIYGGVEDYELHLLEGDKAMTIAEYADLLGVNWRTLVE